MSNAIRYDSLLVRELARELDDALAGARLEGVWLDRERLRLALQVAAARRSDADPPSLVWQLHPAAGHLTTSTEACTGVRVQHRPRVAIAGVHAPPDERILVVTLADDAGHAGAARRIIIELLANQWNVIAVGPDDRITAVLRLRDTAERALRAGVPYEPPRPSARSGAAEPLELDEWLRVLAPVPPPERLQALPRLAAWTSPLSAAWILGRAAVQDATDSAAAMATAAALEHAWQRYRALADGTGLRPVLLHAGGRWQPYVAAADEPGEAMPSLLAAFEEAARRAAAVPRAEADEEALAAVARRLDAVNGRIRRLAEERGGAAEDAQRLRRHADLLLSQLHRVTRGTPQARLDDHEGGSVDVALDPALSPADNARAMYDLARRRDRAAARVPRLLAAAHAERDRLEALAAGIRDGTVDAERIEQIRRARPAAGTPNTVSLPYRVYRSSGGLEIRVGRGARSNDELTFRHSSPSDVWLHARDVAGAHVVLRWSRTDGSPPARDLQEAAVLAALFSRARTSGTVPVDWTRRKYVRKPRRAAPGLVLPERVRTLFVQPDPGLEERLREEETI